MSVASEIKISSAITPTAGAADVSEIDGSTLDMAGFTDVIMVVRMGAITTGAVTSIKAQQGAASDLSDAADLLGSGQTIADTDDEKIFYIEIAKPAKRYLRLVVVRGTENAVVSSAEYIQWGATAKPTSQGTIAGERFITPAEGAA